MQAGFPGSSKNAQPWTFVVPTGARIEELAAAVYVPENVLGAGLVVAILVHGKGPVLFDAGRAAQSMLLAAWAEGIASCPNGISDVELARARLAAGDDETPVIVLSFGLPSDRGIPTGTPSRSGVRGRTAGRSTRSCDGSRDPDERRPRSRRHEDPGCRDRRRGRGARPRASRDPAQGSPEAVVFELAEALREALDDAGVESWGSPGSGSGRRLDRRRAGGRFRSRTSTAGTLRSRSGRRSSRARRPVRIGNDVNVAVEAERRFGAGRGFDSFLGVFWGTGVGGGIVMDGRLSSGAGRPARSGMSARSREGGAATAASTDASRRTPAAVRSRSALARSRGRPTVLFELMEKRGRDRLTSGVWLRALQAGDDVAEELILRGPGARRGIGSAVTLLDVEAVVIGGASVSGSVRSGSARIEAAAKSTRSSGSGPLPAGRARRSRRRDRREPARDWTPASAGRHDRPAHAGRRLASAGSAASGAGSEQVVARDRGDVGLAPAASASAARSAG